MTAQEIVNAAGMIASPGYYSGRGATLSDLDGDILAKINTLIKEHHGQDASKNFIQMVKDIKTLSATEFLNSLYSLQYHNWVHSIENLDKSHGHSPENELQAMMTIAHALSSNAPDHTDSMRADFLRQIGKK